ncbi:hypothetical protein BHE74_00018854 [Ensete ventricosum]|nr:hypothetical protein BHE74_00018854 [Ensete ventricosum]
MARLPPALHQRSEPERVQLTCLAVELLETKEVLALGVAVKVATAVELAPDAVTDPEMAVVLMAMAMVMVMDLAMDVGVQHLINED